MISKNQKNVDYALTLILNHRVERSSLVKGALPEKLRVVPINGYGEDFPIYDLILKKNGWIEKGNCYCKETKDNFIRIVLEGVAVGDSYFVTENPRYETSAEIDGITWADFDFNGDLLFAKNGEIFRKNSSKCKGFEI